MKFYYSKSEIDILILKKNILNVIATKRKLKNQSDLLEFEIIIESELLRWNSKTYKNNNDLIKKILEIYENKIEPTLFYMKEDRNNLKFFISLEISEWKKNRIKANLWNTILTFLTIIIPINHFLNFYEQTKTDVGYSIILITIDLIYWLWFIYHIGRFYFSEKHQSYFLKIGATIFIVGMILGLLVGIIN